MADLPESCMRLFLSADLVGSTVLKNRLNHQELLEKYRARKHVIETLRKLDPELEKHLDAKRSETAILQSLGVSCDDFDWANVVKSFYTDFDAAFRSALLAMGSECERIDEKDREPWKAIGDELIYAVQIRSRRELHYVTIAFLRAVREMDKKVGERERPFALRTKGAAWVAGFPVRNRVVDLASPRLRDFLGPDMDTGFRLGRWTRAGMLVVSVELAELLGECNGNYAPMLGKIVGWEVLKGVWNDQHYPIIWVDFPDSSEQAKPYRAVEFKSWEQEQCRLCKAWESGGDAKQISTLQQQLLDLRTGLPKSLGLVDPYIDGDELEKDGRPDEHRQILALIARIVEYQKSESSQDPSGVDVSERSVERDSEDVKGLVARGGSNSVPEDAASASDFSAGE